MGVFETELTIHWKVVVPLIENTVNEYVKGVVRLFSLYDELFIISSSLYDVPLIIHVTGNIVLLRYPQLISTSLPSQTMSFLGDLVIFTTRKNVCSYICSYVATYTVATDIYGIYIYTYLCM